MPTCSEMSVAPVKASVYSRTLCVFLFLNSGLLQTSPVRDRVFVLAESELLGVVADG